MGPFHHGAPPFHHPGPPSPSHGPMRRRSGPSSSSRVRWGFYEVGRASARWMPRGIGVSHPDQTDMELEPDTLCDCIAIPYMDDVERGGNSGRSPKHRRCVWMAKPWQNHEFAGSFYWFQFNYIKVHRLKDIQWFL